MMNKKILSGLLALIMCMALSACTEAPVTDKPEDSAVETTAAVNNEEVTEDEDVTDDEDTTSDEDTTDDETTSQQETVVTDEEDVPEMLTVGNEFSMAGDETGFTFELDLNGEKLKKGTKVELYTSEGELIAEMTDDGSDPDRIKGDKIYTSVFSPDTDTWETFDVKAVYGENESNTVRVRTYTDKISKEDDEDFRKMVAEFNAISEKYIDAMGEYSDNDKAKVMDEVTALVDKLYAEGRIITMHISRKNGSVNLKHKSGVTFTFTTEIM